MLSFKEYIKNYSGHSDGEKNLMDFSDVTNKYPWFITARHICGQSISSDPLLGIHFLSHPAPQYKLQNMQRAQETAEKNVSEIDNIINTFLNKGDYKIILKDNITDFDASATSNILDTSDDAITEELAEIYKAQGLDKEAEEILNRLKAIKNK